MRICLYSLIPFGYLTPGTAQNLEAGGAAGFGFYRGVAISGPTGNGSALRHDLLEVAIGERVSQVPANAEQDDHVFEVPPAEQCWPFLPSRYTVPDQTNYVCNRTS